MLEWWKALPLLTRGYIILLIVYIVGGLLTFGYAHEVTYSGAWFLKGPKSLFAGLIWPLFWGSKLALWLF